MPIANGKRLTISASTTSDRDIVMCRAFKAPRELVFDAWTKPELFVHWFGPRGWTVPICEMDVRPGGAWFRRMRADT